jgi:hypothetical protein
MNNALTRRRLALALALSAGACSAGGPAGPRMNAAPHARARFDPTLRARVLARRPLRYAEGPDAAEDRPGHVRAGSALAWFGGRLAAVQDDANFVALVRPWLGDVTALALPAGPGGRRQFDDGRGNKRHKLDLEAAAVVRAGGAETLLAFGSGSTPARERVLAIGPGAGGAAAPSVRLVSAPAFYRNLRAAAAFAGAELNVEGALARGDALWLLQRGNGAARRGLAPVNATCAIDLAALLAHLDDPAARPAPGPEGVRTYDLGARDGAPLSFTDAVDLGGRAAYVAVAEASPDVTRDGPVSAVALGLLDDRPRYTWLLDEAGRPLTDKVEGLAADPADPNRLYAVVDRDDADAPAELLHVAVAFA